MDLRIRDAVPSDAMLIGAFNAAMALETESLALDANLLFAGVRSLLSDPAKGRYFLAESSGRVVGQAMVTFEWSDWRNGAFWWIQSVYVEPSVRRQGVFRALYDHVVLETRRAGGVGVRLYVDRHNKAARNTYSRLGMQHAGYEMYEIDFVIPRQ
jgi:GNAT superfamily N-acetyltransferase